MITMSMKYIEIFSLHDLSNIYMDQSLWRPQRIFLLPDICRELWLNLEKFQTRPGLHAFRTKTKRDYNGYEDR